MLFEVEGSNLCQSPVFIDCTCATGEREGLLLVCNGLPTPKKEDLTSIRVVHIYIEGKGLPDTVQYIPNIWPRMRSIENKNKTLSCSKGVCSLPTIDVNEITSTSFVKQKTDLLPSTEEMITEYANGNTLTELKKDPILTTTDISGKITQLLDKTTIFNNQQAMHITVLQNDFEETETTTAMMTENKTRPNYKKLASSHCSDNKLFFILGLTISMTLNVGFSITLVIMSLNRQKQSYQQSPTHDAEMVETSV